AGRWGGEAPARSRRRTPNTPDPRARGWTTRVSCPARLLFELGAELQERGVPQGRDLSGFDRGPNRTIGLVVVGAVAEPALAEKAAELGVGLIEVARADAPQGKGADSGGVDQLEIGFGAQQPGGRGGVSALAGLGIDLGGDQVEGRHERVEQRALADA